MPLGFRALVPPREKPSPLHATIVSSLHAPEKTERSVSKPQVTRLSVWPGRIWSSCSQNTSPVPVNSLCGHMDGAYTADPMEPPVVDAIVVVNVRDDGSPNSLAVSHESPWGEGLPAAGGGCDGDEGSTIGRIGLPGGSSGGGGGGGSGCNRAGGSRGATDAGGACVCRQPPQAHVAGHIAAMPFP